jgi:radical SAM protein with 4Fe4S-binding SPASM domain
VKLRPDGGRAILFSVNPSDSTSDEVFCFLHPQHAVMLTLFDGKHDRHEIEKTVAYLFGLNAYEAYQQVEILLDLSVNRDEHVRSLIIDSEQNGAAEKRTYDPKTFIVSAEKIDMSHVRCNIPSYLLILPTMRCVTDCIYCYADRTGPHGKKEFNIELYDRLLREAQQCGIETVEFSGGDFFCRRDAFTLIACTLERGLYPVIPTKCPLSKEQVKHLADLGLHTLQISIDALSPGIIDAMVRVPGYGAKVLNTLQYLGEAGIRVRTNTVLTPLNIDDARSLAKYLARLPHVFRSNYTCYARSLFRHSDDLFCSPGDIASFEREVKALQKSYPHKGIFFDGGTPNPYEGSHDRRASKFGSRAMCTANRRGVVVLPDGRVTICEELYFHESFIIGDLNKQSLLEVWNSRRALELSHPDQNLVPDGACRDCADFTRCHEGLGRCFRESLKAYGMDRPHWPDPRCPRAPLGNRLT